MSALRGTITNIIGGGLYVSIPVYGDVEYGPLEAVSDGSNLKPYYEVGDRVLLQQVGRVKEDLIVIGWATPVAEDPPVYPVAPHFHPLTDINGLQAALDSKQAKGNYSLVGHTHTIANVSGLQTNLDSLQTAINGKANNSHSHSMTDIPILTIGASEDLDNYTTSGRYHQRANANASSGTNYPVSLAGLLVVEQDGSMVYQTYTAYNSGTVYTRSRYGTTWYPWKQTSYDGHTHAQSDVTGLSAALAAKSDTGHQHTQSDVPGAAWVPPGAITAYGGATAPSGWLLCDGSTYSRTTYSDLFAVIGTTYGNTTSSNFRVPDLRDRVAVGVSATKARGATGGSEVNTLTVSNMPSHTHSVTIGSGGSHTHSASTNTTGSHNHAATTGTAGDHSHSGTTDTDGSHSHSASSSSEGGTAQIRFHGTGSATVLSQASGGGVSAATARSQYRSGGGNASGATSYDGWNHNWVHSHTIAVSSAGSHNHTYSTNTTGDHTHSVVVSSAGLHSHTVTVDSGGSHTHTATVSSEGGGSSFSIMQPYVALNYIIKA